MSNIVLLPKITIPLGIYWGPHRQHVTHVKEITSEHVIPCIIHQHCQHFQPNQHKSPIESPHLFQRIQHRINFDRSINLAASQDGDQSEMCFLHPTGASCSWWHGISIIICWEYAKHHTWSPYSFKT